MLKKAVLFVLMAAPAAFAQSPNHTPQHFELQRGAPCQPIEDGDTISVTLRPKWATPPPPDFREHFGSQLYFVKKDSPRPQNLQMPFENRTVGIFSGSSSYSRPDDFMRITYGFQGGQHEGGEFTLRFARFGFYTPRVVGNTEQYADTEPVMLEYCVLLKNTVPIPPDQLHGDGIQFAPPHHP